MSPINNKKKKLFEGCFLRMSNTDFVHYICYRNFTKFEIYMAALFLEIREVLPCLNIVGLELESLISILLFGWVPNDSWT